ncbi:uncharacterized protein LOC118203198 [Stegodyphus dumicola]|uniref:uncharacterized protein LOC118203198 n=1 Tax=Stegodyphus dumicola TaxID=202533 RepID=UPI0015AB2276|nr:uncharacterized protein LOC118203198 [Stegodyphus dumicola]
MKFVILFPLCFWIVLIDGKPKGYYGGKGVAKLMEMANQAGFLHYTIHSYDFNPFVSWAKYVESIQDRDDIGILKGISRKEIDEIFGSSKDEKSLKIIHYFVISFEVHASDMFTVNGSEWILRSNKKKIDLQNNVDEIVTAQNPTLEMKGAEKFTIQFDLGPQQDTEKLRSTAYYFQNPDNKETQFEVMLLNPALHVYVKDSVQSMKYRIIMYILEKDEMLFPGASTDLKNSKVIPVLTEITHEILKETRNLYTESAVEVLHSYEDIAISLQDYRFYDFLRNWITKEDDNYVEISLHGAVKQAVLDPDSILRFTSSKLIPHDIHETEAPAPHRYFNVDREIFPLRLGNTTAPPGHLESKVPSMLKHLEKNRINEKKFENLRQWLLNEIKADFESYPGRNTKVEFKKLDHHFSVRTKYHIDSAFKDIVIQTSTPGVEIKRKCIKLTSADACEEDH